MTEKDLGLGSQDDEVNFLEFSRHSFRFQLGNAFLRISAPFEITWDDGSAETYDPTSDAGAPVSARLMSALLGAKVTESVSGIEQARLRLAFDTGVRLAYTPTYSPWEDWEAKNPEGVLFIAQPDDEMTWFEKEGEATEPEPEPTPEPEWYEGTEPREIDLDMNAHLYGVTVYGASVQLETRAGSIYIAGPFTVTDIDGEEFVFDPENLIDDEVAGAILAVLIDHMIESAVLKPETSELTIRLKGGERLDWKARSTAQAQFSAKHHNGRQFWSKGDGTVYWYGGPEGTHPKFLIGGPRKGE